ncbi:MAG: HAD-IIB family hydrolase [Thermodesulfobacteriota bacterium]
MPSEFVIFTDLDGTLLDHKSYSFEVALPALELIKSKSIPLIMCTSKTRAEIEHYRELLNNSDPFISENGGGIFIPSAYFSHQFKHDKQVNGYMLIELGTPHEILINELNSIKKDQRIKLKGLSEMTIKELSEVSGLTKEQAKLAKKREYDEPFIMYGDDGDRETIKRAIIGRGFRHAEGGIFHHIMGENDKGKAVKTLIKLFEEKFSELKTIGIGDSLNDLPMLEAVDMPILVKKPSGQCDPRINVPNLVFAQGIGPGGWNNAILNFLEERL